MKFIYKKNEDEITQREVLVLSESFDTTYIDAIDMSHLSEEEIDQLLKIRKDYEKALEPFVKKAFRRFSKSKITIIKEGENVPTQ